MNVDSNRQNLLPVDEREIVEPAAPPTESPYGAAIAIGSMISVTVVLWIATGFIVSPAGPSILGFSTFHFGLLVFNCSMIGFWFGLGKHWWRFIVCAVLAPLTGVFADALLGGNDLLEFEIFCFGITATVAVTTLALRFWKGRLQRVSDDQVHSEGLQFGIKHIFIWTTAIAIFFGIGKAIYENTELISDFGNNQFSMLFSIGGLAFVMAVSMVFNIWAILGFRISAFKIIILIGVTVVAAYLCYLLIDEIMFSAALVVSQFCMFVALMLLRWQKIRFVK